MGRGVRASMQRARSRSAQKRIDEGTFGIGGGGGLFGGGGLGGMLSSFGGGVASAVGGGLGSIGSGLSSVGGALNSAFGGISDGLSSAGSTIGGAINDAGGAIEDAYKSSEVYDAAKTVENAAEDVRDRGLELSTYTDPFMEGLSKIDEEVLGGFLFGGINYRPDLSTTPDMNITPETLRYMNPEQARMMAEREFINQRMANFNTVPQDAGTASTMPLWDYYNAVGDRDSANAAAFNAAREEFGKQYQPVQYDDWGNPTDYSKLFGNVRSVTQREQNPYLWDVTTDNGRYTYVPSALTSGLIGDRRAVRVQSGIDEQGNPIYTETDTPGQTAIWVDGVDWTKGHQVAIDPTRLVGGLNSLRVGDFDYDIQGGNLNQGFFFNDADLANLKLERGEQTARLMYPDVQGGMAGDVAPFLQVAGMFGMPWLTAIGTGLSSAQQQKLADDMRAKGYDVDSGKLHRGHALNAAKTLAAYTFAPQGQGGLGGYEAVGNTVQGWGLTGNEAAAAAAGLRGVGSGAMSGAAADRENWLRGAWESGIQGGVVGAGSSYLSGLVHGYDAAGNPIDKNGMQITGAALGQELGKQWQQGPGKSYADRLAAMYANNPVSQVGDPTDLANALKGSGTTSQNFNPVTQQQLQFEGVWDPAMEWARSQVPNLIGQFANLQSQGYGMAGVGSMDDVKNQQMAAISELGLAKAMNDYYGGKRGMGSGGAGGVGGLGSIQMAGIQGAGGGFA